MNIHTLDPKYKYEWMVRSVGQNRKKTDFKLFDSESEAVLWAWEQNKQNGKRYSIFPIVAGEQ